MTSDVSYIQTPRGRIACRETGTDRDRVLLFLHGNLSSSVYIEPLFPFLRDDFHVIAPDLRCFGDTEDLPLDATRGYRDWSDDLFALADALHLKTFDLCGWSMGGNVAMQFACDHPQMVSHLILLCPGSPYGFGGTYDVNGAMHTPAGLGSGAGCAHPGLTIAIRQHSRLFLRDILTKYYFTPPFRMSWEWENRFLDAIGKIKTGDDRYPGNYTVSDVWPYVIAGDKGVLNAMSPAYADLRPFLDIKDKPPVLWIRGAHDRIVSDESMMEMGYLGEIGLIPGYPGRDVYPPQPMIAQLSAFFDLYEKAGGHVARAVIDGGHMCALESPEQFISAVRAFVTLR